MKQSYEPTPHMKIEEKLEELKREFNKKLDALAIQKLYSPD